jgi:hypothetical protein
MAQSQTALRVSRQPHVKSKIILALILSAITVILLLILGGVYHAMARITWHNFTGAGIKYLAEGIERYKSEHATYPSSLRELLAGSEPEWTNYMHRSVFNDRFADKYEYHLQTNGFVIRVIRPRRWYLKGETLEKKYNAEEAIK